LIGASVERVNNGYTLVEQAGTTMGDILQAVRRVTDIMGEIAAASEEQSSGISQVGRAVTQMDEVTQQNAALVEQAAAAASSLQDQAARLRQAIGMFRVNGSEAAIASTTAASAAKKSATTVAKAPSAPVAPVTKATPDAAPRVATKPVAKPAAKSAEPLRPAKVQSSDDDWTTF